MKFLAETAALAAGFAVNILTVIEQQSIRTLAERGWFRRRIARELGHHRETVGRYLGPATAPAAAGTAEPSKPAIPPTGFVAGRRSACEPFCFVLEAGAAQRLYQELVSEQGFAGDYDSAKRFVREWRTTAPLAFRRMEVASGEEVQTDYGQGAWVLEPHGTRYRPHLLAWSSGPGARATRRRSDGRPPRALSGDGERLPRLRWGARHQLCSDD